MKNKDNSNEHKILRGAISGNITFVSSDQEVEQIKQQLVNLGVDKNDIITEFVSGPNEYLIQVNSNDCNNEFSELLEKFLHDNKWVSFRKIKYDKEKNVYLY
jgi:hypothetical protein